MNVSSPTNADEYNEPQFSSTDSTTAGNLSSNTPSHVQQKPICTDKTDSELSRISSEKFANQVQLAARSLCADSPEDDVPSSSSLSTSKLSLNRQNRKCKSAIIQVDGRSFTIGEIDFVFILFKDHI